MVITNLFLTAATLFGGPAIAADVPLSAGATAQASVDGPDLAELYRALQATRNMGSGRFRKILRDFVRLGEESQEQVLDSVRIQMQIEEKAEAYRKAKDDGEKKKLRADVENLVEKAFDAQLARHEARAKALREEARLLDEETGRRKKRRGTMIEDKVRQVLSEGGDWEL